MTLIEEFKNRSDVDGLPFFTNEEWKYFRSQHDKALIRTTLAEYIHQYNVEFPFKQFNETDIRNLFIKFYNTSHLSWLMNIPADEVSEKCDYMNSYQNKPLGIINKSHYYNPISEHFQQRNRLSCDSINSDAPLTIWNDIDKLKGMNWHFWRDGALGDSDICPASFRSAFRLGTYTATQFKPSVAKFLYEYHNAVNVLDTSCGWGDRLAAFYGTPNTKLYVGCDPNPVVFEVYKQQCLAYESYMGIDARLIESEDYFECIGSKTVKIWRKPAEDVDWSLYVNTFDFYFTSPPYFNTEKYGTELKSEDQSWNRYDTFDKWKTEFLYRVTKQVWQCIKSNGYMMINIIDPTGKKQRHKLCDDMVEYCTGLDKCFYVGKFGMRMMGRPHTSDVNGCLIEPIWVFMKNQSEYSSEIGLEAFM